MNKGKPEGPSRTGTGVGEKGLHHYRNALSRLETAQHYLNCAAEELQLALGEHSEQGMHLDNLRHATLETRLRLAAERPILSRDKEGR